MIKIRIFAPEKPDRFRSGNSKNARPAFSLFQKNDTKKGASGA